MQAVLFDFFGVVARPHSISTPLAAMLKRPLSDVRLVYDGYERGTLTREEFWSRLAVKDADLMEKNLFASFRIDPEFRRVHEILKKDYATAVVSNADSLLIRTLLRRFGLEDAFEAVVVSAEAKAAKPEPRIYRLALAELDVNAKECVFVDDRVPNLVGAHGLGMTTVHHLIEPYHDGYKPDYTIDVLSELLKVMEGLG